MSESTKLITAAIRYEAAYTIAYKEKNKHNQRMQEVSQLDYPECEIESRKSVLKLEKAQIEEQKAVNALLKCARQYVRDNVIQK